MQVENEYQLESIVNFSKLGFQQPSKLSKISFYDIM